MDWPGFFLHLFFFSFCEFCTCNNDAGSCLFRRTYYVGAFLSVLPEQRSGAVSLDFPSHGVMGRDDAIACFFRGFSTS